MKTEQEINIGVDTGKHQLDIYIRPVGEYFCVENNDKGIKEAIVRIKKHKPTRIRFSCESIEPNVDGHDDSMCSEIDKIEYK